MIFFTVIIDFHDGTSETVESVTHEYVTSEGVLKLFNKNGEMAPEIHLGSWPLTGIKKWRRQDRW